MERLNHWEDVYGRKEANEVSWFAPHLSRSLAMIHAVTPKTAGSSMSGAARPRWSMTF